MKRMQCPHCFEYVTPEPNHGQGTALFEYGDLKDWIGRNPLVCPKCNRVGGIEDFEVE